MSSTDIPDDMITTEQIRKAAYYLWQARGCPHGEPERDWWEAEALLRDPLSTTGKPLQPPYGLKINESTAHHE